MSRFHGRHPAPDGSLGRVRELFELMDELRRLQSHDVIRSRVLDVTSKLGVTLFTVCRLPQPRRKIGAYTLLTNWPQEWLDHYDEEEFYRYDPIATACLTGVRPVVWSEAIAGRELGRMERRVMADAKAIGMSDGLSVPIVDINGFQAVVSMAGDRFELDPDGLKALHLLALVAYETAERLAGIASPPSERLSLREREVLQFAAGGYTQQQTAHELGISVETAISHGKNARMKLGANTIAHAIVKALRENKLRL